MAGRSMKLGGGGRFAALESKLAGRPGVTNPEGLAAAIGRAKLGKSKFQGLATKGAARADRKSAQRQPATKEDQAEETGS